MSTRALCSSLAALAIPERSTAALFPTRHLSMVFLQTLVFPFPLFEYCERRLSRPNSVYCSFLIIGFLFASCSFNIPSNSSSSCWLPASNLSAILEPRTIISTSPSVTQAADRTEIKTSALFGSRSMTSHVSPRRSNTLERLLNLKQPGRANREILSGWPLHAVLHLGLTPAPKSQRKQRAQDRAKSRLTHLRLVSVVSD